MLERIVASGLHVQVIVAVVSAALLRVYCKLIVRTRWFGEERLHDRAFRKDHKARVALLLGFPSIVVGVLIEELIFRAPLILVFEGWNRQAWLWVALSSILFGFIHYVDNMWVVLKSHASDESVKDESGNEVSDLRERFRLVKERTRVSRVLRISRGSVTGCLGFGFAYIGITQQSLYVVVGVHFLWNIVAPLVLTILVPLAIIPLLLVRAGWDLLVDKFDALKGR